jgi:hypothetical protein
MEFRTIIRPFLALHLMKTIVLLLTLLLSTYSFNCNWRDRWDEEAQLEIQAYQVLSEEELLEQIKRGKTGHYYQIWRVIAEKGTITHAVQILWEFLKGNPGTTKMLDRYHCAGALFAILGMPDPDCRDDLRMRMQWDHNGEEARQIALLELSEIIQQRRKSWPKT